MRTAGTIDPIRQQHLTEKASNHGGFFFFRRDRTRPTPKSRSVVVLTADRTQSPLDHQFLAWLEKVRIERTGRCGQFDLAAQPRDFLLSPLEAHPQQQRRGADARVSAHFAERLEAEHPSIKGHVTRIDFDQQVGAMMDSPRADVRNMEQRCQQRLRVRIVVDGQLREFGDAPALHAQPVRLLRVQSVDEQAALFRVEADGDGADDPIGVVRRNRYSTRHLLHVIVDGISSPRIAALDQVACGFAPRFRVGKPYLEQIGLRRGS